MTRVIERTYTIFVDLDDDAEDEAVQVTERLEVEDLDGDGAYSDLEARWALDRDALTRSARIAGSEGEAALAFTGGYAAPALVSELELDPDGVAELEAEISAAERTEWQDEAAGVHADLEVTPISQRSSASELRDYYCGPTVLLMALAPHGLSPDSSDDDPIATIAGRLGTGTSGTGWPDLIRVAGDYGLELRNVGGPDDPVENMNQLHVRVQEQLAQGNAVILSVGFSELTGEEDLGTTHYVMVTGYENGRYTVVDPWSGAELELTVEEFESAVEGRLEALGQVDPGRWRQYYLLAVPGT